MSEVYVQVLYDYLYHTDDGNEIKMKAGEELLLVKKSNENWWQVIRNSDNQPFYAPSKYLSIIGLNCLDSTKLKDVNSNFQQSDILLSADAIHKVTVKPKHVTTRSEFKQGNGVRVKQLTDALSFNNPLCENEFLSFDYSHNGSQQKVPLVNELSLNEKLEMENLGICDTSFSHVSCLICDVLYNSCIFSINMSCHFSGMLVFLVILF